MKKLQLLFLALALFLQGTALAALEAVNPRGGLSNFAAKAAAGENVRVAYLGGSITASTIGWRVMTTAFLREEFPSANVKEIFAAIPGTDSMLGACRVRTQVLDYAPDLLFVEFAVNNDGMLPADIRESAEGIVRQARRSNPKMDICFVYTASQRLLEGAYMLGRSSLAAQQMDEVAAHYGIPSIQLGVEVARLMREGQLVARGPSGGLDEDGRDGQGRIVFTSDGIHPLRGGHRVYLSVIEPALKKMFRQAAAKTDARVTALSEDSWENAGILPVGKLKLDGAWEEVPGGDERTNWQPANLTPPLWLASKAGAGFTADFEGTRVGLLGMKGPDNGRFRVTVDKLPPVEGTFFDGHSTEGRYRISVWWFPKTLAPGRHTIRVELLDEKTSPIDKIGILKKRGYTPSDPEPFEKNYLYLCGLLLKEMPR